MQRLRHGETRNKRCKAVEMCVSFRENGRELLQLTVSRYLAHCSAHDRSHLGAEFVTSRRGNLMIVHEGRTFIHERSMGTVIPRSRWVCNKKRWLKCRASLTTVDGIIVKKYGTHNHH
ncbi:uncharacterized protein LOC114354780 [Ostrinia furnacalis]|uniref:uncharacterized protein LOC114354780 n=1 Tax=Ostrinia furnacalis TaxID=93504 RepID=UPI00103B210D|nr:uncharacterized protein LOC114354780 [Ostrinia furnacalis]